VSHLPPCILWAVRLNRPQFRSQQSRLGGGIQRFLKKQAAADTTPADPPADENISKDDNPAVQPPLIALPTQAQLDLIIKTASSLSPLKAKQTELLKVLDDFKAVDVVAGAGPLTNSQKVAIADAGSPGVKIPPLTEPFNQVVLVTDKGAPDRPYSVTCRNLNLMSMIAMGALSFVSQEPLPTCLAAKQPLLVEFLKKKAAATAAAEAAEQAAAAAKGGAPKTPLR